jgi:hypothetical protein
MPSLRLDPDRLFSVLAAAVARSRLPYFVETGSRDYGSEILVTTGTGEPVIVMELRDLAGPPRLAVDRATLWLPHASVLDLVLIPRDELAARHFKRCPPGHWREIDLAGPHAALRLAALQTEIPLISLFG